MKWKKDGWRHSYASYRLALTQNAHALAEEMGNSVHMIRTHYLDLKHEDEAQKWFQVRKVPKAPKPVLRDVRTTNRQNRRVVSIVHAQN